MPIGKTVLFIGLHPDVVDYARWPGLTTEKLLASLERDRAALGGLGYDAVLCLVDSAETVVNAG